MSSRYHTYKHVYSELRYRLYRDALFDLSNLFSKRRLDTPRTRIGNTLRRKPVRHVLEKLISIRKIESYRLGIVALNTTQGPIPSVRGVRGLTSRQVQTAKWNIYKKNKHIKIGDTPLKLLFYYVGT